MAESHIQLLQSMPIFGGISQDTLKYLLNQAQTVSVPQGKYFFQEGDPGDAMYVLEQGEVAIIKSWEGQRHVLRHLGCGDAFGEMALIDLFPRSAGVLAIQNAEAIQLTHSLLFDVYAKNLEQFTLIQMNIGRELSRRLRVADNLLFKAKMEKSVRDADHTFHAL